MFIPKNWGNDPLWRWYFSEWVEKTTNEILLHSSRSSFLCFFSSGGEGPSAEVDADEAPEGAFETHMVGRWAKKADRYEWSYCIYNPL